MEYEQVLYEVRDDVGLISLNRPERRNAWTPRTDQEKFDAVTRANDDPGEMQRLIEAYRTPEHREAVKAFLEKRPPRFR